MRIETYRQGSSPGDPPIEVEEVYREGDLTFYRRTVKGVAVMQRDATDEEDQALHAEESESRRLQARARLLQADRILLQATPLGRVLLDLMETLGVTEDTSG